MSELENLCLSLEESLCLRASFFKGLLLSRALLGHWLFSTCCRRKPTHTSEDEVDRHMWRRVEKGATSHLDDAENMENDSTSEQNLDGQYCILYFIFLHRIII